VIEPGSHDQRSAIEAHFQQRLAREPAMLTGLHPVDPGRRGYAGRSIVSLVDSDRLRRILERALDDREFLGDFGISSVSRMHDTEPYLVHTEHNDYAIRYRPGPSDVETLENAAWRGSISLPINVLLIRALLQFYRYYGPSFIVECPTGSGRSMNLFEVARDIAGRLRRIFVRDAHGRRPLHGDTQKFQNDPEWRDHLLFYECFHARSGAGLGASHKTGCTGLIAPLIQMFWTLDPSDVLEGHAHSPHTWTDGRLTRPDAGVTV
jgi:hypothetical protein